MASNLFPQDEINYRAIYGKLFSALLSHFGATYIPEIEDAIQNSFLKLLKLWNKNHQPDNKENWLFIVARNDLLNQLKKNQKHSNVHKDDLFVDGQELFRANDLRLQTIIFIASLEHISTQAKVTFTLKNIFGLSITEIHHNTLLNQDAIYKSIKRTITHTQQIYQSKNIDVMSISANEQSIKIIEDVLYSIFNIGFDSFSEKSEGIVNEDLCMEAFSMTKLLYEQYRFDSTSNLLSLFSFHIARLPAKIENGKLVSFFKQNRHKWNESLIRLGFHYLRQPDEANKFYLEAIIICKYMTTSAFMHKDWEDIVQLYKNLLQISPSPIVKLNYCYCLSKIGEVDQALQLLSDVESELPDMHTYYNLVKAKIMKEINPKASVELFTKVMHHIRQQSRKEYLLENEILHE